MSTEISAERFGILPAHFPLASLYMISYTELCSMLTTAFGISPTFHASSYSSNHNTTPSAPTPLGAGATRVHNSKFNFKFKNQTITHWTTRPYRPARQQQP